jgi:3-isopropylmalate/(R)-2-methylmalate dehydratase small subunit
MSGPVAIVEGRGLPLPGHDIDTDRIMPARFLKSVSFEGLEAHVFADDRVFAGKEGRLHPFDNPAYAGASILIVNRNFGCGSSREHAPQGLLRAGIRAVVGESFSEIFQGNSLALGIPCAQAGADEVSWLLDLVTSEPGTRIRLDVSEQTLEAGGRVIPIALGPATREALLTGLWDATGMLLGRYDEVEAVADRLPYLRGF